MFAFSFPRRWVVSQESRPSPAVDGNAHFYLPLLSLLSRRFGVFIFWYSKAQPLPRTFLLGLFSVLPGKVEATGQTIDPEAFNL